MTTMKCFLTRNTLNSFVSMCSTQNIFGFTCLGKLSCGWITTCSYLLSHPHGVCDMRHVLNCTQPHEVKSKTTEQKFYDIQTFLTKCRWIHEFIIKIHTLHQLMWGLLALWQDLSFIYLFKFVLCVSKISMN